MYFNAYIMYCFYKRIEYVIFFGDRQKPYALLFLNFVLSQMIARKVMLRREIKSEPALAFK